MNIDLLIDNLTNPALLFFVLGIVTVYLKSDLEIPQKLDDDLSLSIHNEKFFYSAELVLVIFARSNCPAKENHTMLVELVFGLLSNQIGEIYFLVSTLNLN
jgi:hypothetical protein